MRLPAPMPLLKRPSPFDHPDWKFELKYDGFRALAVLRDGGVVFHAPEDYITIRIVKIDLTAAPIL